MERIWGGDQMRRMLNKAVPSGKTIGESWMISDHAAHISVVSEGPLAGRTLHQLLERDSMALLGVNAAPTRDGQFPLLLKLIDAGQDLSVQVHPDDELAYQLGEQDMGKTEMWHVLETEGQCRIMLGLRRDVTREALEQCLRDGGDVIGLMGQLPVRGGESFHVPSGTVHAIGGGVLQPAINSLITKRVADNERGGILGISAAFLSGANALAPLLGGVVFQWGGASAPFWLWAAIMGLLLIASLRTIKDTRAAP